MTYKSKSVITKMVVKGEFITRMELEKYEEYRLKLTSTKRVGFIISFPKKLIETILLLDLAISWDQVRPESGIH